MSWCYSLSDESNPFVRLGIHGLARLLKAGESQALKEHYPLIRPSERMSWTVGKDSIALHFEEGDEDVLLPLAWGMLGDLHEGLAVMPGYCPDLGDPAVYATLHGHMAQAKFRSSNGMARCSSLGSKSKRTLALHTNRNGHPVQATFTKNELAYCAKNKEGKLKRGLRLAHKEELKTVHHQVFSKWNDKGIPTDVKTGFVLYFALLAYTWTRCDEGVFGVGIDLPTFEDADAVHSYHGGWSTRGRSGKTRHLYRVHSRFRTAAQVLATNLNLPPGNYEATCADTSEHFTLTHRTGGQKDLILQLIRNRIQFLDEKRFLRELKTLPLSLYKTAKGEDGDVYTSVYDQLMDNARMGRPWPYGLCALGELKRTGANVTGLYASEAYVLSDLCEELGDEMEKLWMAAMRKLFVSLARSYRQIGWDDPYGRARKVMVNQHLMHVRTKGQLVEAITACLKEAEQGAPIISERMWDWLMSHNDVVYLRGLFTVSVHIKLSDTTINAHKVEMGWSVETEEPAPEPDLETVPSL